MERLPVRCLHAAKSALSLQFDTNVRSGTHNIHGGQRLPYQPKDLLTLHMGDVKMNASELIDDLIAKLTDWRGVTFTSIRKIIRDADPEIVEEWKWMGTPVWSHDGIVCVANTFKDKVKLTFYEGASLPDPDKLFNNGLEGKKWRTIDFFKDDKINGRSLTILVQAAVNHNHSKAKTAIKTHGTRSTVKNKPAK